jgi:hypothetical protein
VYPLNTVLVGAYPLYTVLVGEYPLNTVLVGAYPLYTVNTPYSLNTYLEGPVFNDVIFTGFYRRNLTVLYGNWRPK